MKRYKLILLMTFLGGMLAAQEGFNIVYTNPYFEDGIAAGIAHGHVVHEDHIYVMAETYDADTVFKAYWLKYDLQGNLLDSAFVPLFTPGFAADIFEFGNLIHEEDGIIFPMAEICDVFDCTPLNSDSLVKLDWNGEVVWKYGLEVDTTGYQVEYYDGVCAYEEGYLAFGFITDTVGSLSFSQIKGLLTRLDAEGHILWHRRYEDVLEIKHCRVDQSGNIFLMGRFADDFPNATESLVMKVDSAGQLKWRYGFGHNPGDEINDSESTPVAEFIDDSTMLIMSSDGGKDGFDDINGPLWTQKLVDNGNSYQVIDDAYFIYSDVRNECWNSLLTSSGNMAVIGTGGRFLYPPDVDSTQWPNGIYNQDEGTLFMLSPELDSLWMRYYTFWDYEEFVLDPIEWLYDITELPDGGFILSGDARLSPFADPGPLHHIWLLRVDSLGCIEPGCHLISGLQEQVIGLQGSMTVSPNPWQQGDPLRLQFTARSSGIMPYQQETTRLVIYDLQGRSVYEQPIPPSVSPDLLVELHPPSLASGQYILHWMSSSGAWYDSEKLVVE